MQLGRIDLDEERAQLADALARLRGSLAQLRVERSRGALRPPPRANTTRREILDDAVVEVVRDAPPLDVGGVDRC